ncbi:hypothetical protein GcC1_100023 [Golovinomyces cichoracearum]|uniref:Chromo domain-containing protein n=1 Tax=Golovinomyces cichoracearum TaxID=62708 RepID=A0A420IA44_9PEZI|nr:hypothetical protein GcC1_100023 [Golovinomyces cichoracearum]
MPVKQCKLSRRSKARDYDSEPGMHRLSRKTKKSKPLPDPFSESEVTASESDIESEYEIEIAEVHRQKILPSRSRKFKAQQDIKNMKSRDEPLVDESKIIAPSVNFLVALAYRQGTSAVQFDARSYFVPDCSSLFSASLCICNLLTPNPLVHEIDPGFTSIVFYLYVAHFFYYHILRVRDVAGELAREERRCLPHYENIGPSEAWPIPLPLVGILQSFGIVTPPSKNCAKIVPTLPNFNGSIAAQFGYSSQHQETPPPLEIAPSGHEIHEVEAILDSRIRQIKVVYLVRWIGTSDTAWEPYEHLDNCKESLLEFHETYLDAPRSAELAT